jgi:hypothetical protein
MLLATMPAPFQHPLQFVALRIGQHLVHFRTHHLARDDHVGKGLALGCCHVLQLGIRCVHLRQHTTPVRLVLSQVAERGLVLTIDSIQGLALFRSRIQPIGQTPPASYCIFRWERGLS